MWIATRSRVSTSETMSARCSAPLNGRGTRVSLFLSAAMVVALTLATSGTARAVCVGTRTVAVTGNDTGNDCSNPFLPCATIQHAVDAAASLGEIVKVGAGTYNAQVQIFNKTLTLCGAQSGVPAGPGAARSGSESILTHADGPVQICGDNITIDGFTIEGASNTGISSFGAGIWTSFTSCGPNHGGYTIINNIIQNNIIGLYPNSDGTNLTTIQHNLFSNNNVPGPAGGSAIYSDLGASNMLIDSNKFTGSTDWGILFAGPVGTQSNITVSNNVLTTDSAIGLISVTTASITGNVSTDSVTHGVYLDGDDGVTISGNTIVNAGTDYSGIRLRGDSGANTNIHILMNTIVDSDFGIRVADIALTGGSMEVHYNRIFNNLSGITNESTTDIDAINNWWGCNGGPNGIGMLGPCDTATPAVTFAPWVTLTISASPTSINQCQTADITASTLINSFGADISPDHIPDGVLVTFATDLGNVAPATANLTNGVAHTTLSPGCILPDGVATSGNAHVSASMDNEQVTTVPEGEVSTGVVIIPSAPWIIQLTRLRAAFRRPNGLIVMRALMNDTDTGGELVPSLLAGTVVVKLHDSSGNLNGTIPLTTCVQRPSYISCRNAGVPGGTVRATFKQAKGLPLVYRMYLSWVRVPVSVTGATAPVSPIFAQIQETPTVCRFDCIANICRARGKNNFCTEP